VKDSTGTLSVAIPHTVLRSFLTYAWFLAILFVRFTAGVGENFSVVRSSACSKMEYLGLRLNEERNAKPIPEEDFAARTRLRCLRCRIASSLISAFGHVEDQ
jgi:acetate kinase